ncbi:hypothetical protein GPECTOR_3g373 [Gonium pectorale]|uniref:Cytochrome P450 n=1 Tax=Gonium pectorale TaxID=33097 RepID=A0A150GZT3_GONPE|nr:hypothetical protein GPECTOR_3g373 [Gonium pectorale]|eukprot:KXZ55232.1 hypothetical protein GPECTOR_3g373 [Gonium pectorale]
MAILFRPATRPGPSGSPPASSTAPSTGSGFGSFGGLGGGSGDSGDLRLELWLSLLQASAAQLTAVGSAAAAAASGAAERLQRLSSPPPPAFPAGPPGDATLSLLTDPLAFLTTSTARYGKVVGLLLGGERVVLVSGQEEARAVLIEQAGTTYVKEGTAFFPGSSLAGNGLLVSDGPVWQRQRRLANPAFRRTAVEAYGSAMVAATHDMLDNVWASGRGA